MKQPSELERLEAACAAVPRKAMTILWGREPGFVYEDERDFKRIKECLTFSQERLLTYIQENHLGDQILYTASDNRGFPSAYVTKKDGYEVG